jgi:hypothetical protein
MAIEAELADGRVLEFPDGTDPSVIQATVKRVLASSQPTTMLGGAKELFKGLVPGAVGLVESAATGASALLPEDMEKSAREKIKSVAAAAKAPFAAAPGYEESIPRKLSEAIGSTAPFLLAGPFGLAGRAAAVGMGVGAGAGEARTRAEQEGATADQRGTATALGVIPGALEAFAPIRILSRIPTASKAAGVEAVKRAFVAGGEEAAQEVASGLAQNMIARGVYKPEQALIDGLGEQAAYGGATGAIVQGLLDLAIGRRARGAAAAKAEDDAAAAAKAAAQPTPPSLPLVTAPGVQGELLAPDERAVPAEPDRDLFGKPVVRAPEPAEPPAAMAVPEGQQDLGLDFQREYADMATERERLRQQPQTPEVKARVAELTGQMQLFTQSDIESIRAEKELAVAAAAEDAATRKKFPALANAPDLLTQPDEVKARTQGELFPGEDLGEGVVEPKIPEAKKPEEPGEPTPVPTYARSGPYQYKLPMRGGEVAQPFTLQNVLDTGIAPSTTKGWFEKNVVGKTQAEVQAMVDKDPTLVDGPGKRAKILRELLAPQPAPFKEKPSEPTPAPTPAVEQRDEPRAGEPSVGVPSEPAAPIVPEPGAGAPATAGEPVAPDGRGLVSAGRPVVSGDGAQGTEPAAVTPAKPAPAPAPAPAPTVEAEAADAEAARKAEAEDMKRRLEALEKAQRPTPAAAKPAPAAPKKAEPSKPIPEKMYEPTGTSEFGMEEGQKEILRGPQAMLFPMTKKEEIEYAERKKPEAEAEEAPAAAKKDKRQMELDFTKEPELEPATPTKTSTPSDEATLKAISGKPMVDVAQWAAQNLPDPDQKVIAQRVLVKLRQLQDMGVVLNPVKVADEGRRLIGALGSTNFRGKRTAGSGPVTITITLNHPSNGTLSGTTPEVILHELLHAATLGAIEVGRYKSAEGTKVGTAVRELLALQSAVVKHFNDRAASGTKLTDFEQRYYNGMNNALADSHEILVWSMTNREMQQYMETIPYKGQTAWNKFVTYVRDLLGIPAKADTALSEALRVGDTLLGLTKEEMEGAQKQTGKQFAKSYTAEDVVDSMGDLTPIDKRGVLGMFKGAQDSERAAAEPSRGVKFRVAVADSAAAVEDKLSGHFNGAVRDSLGKLNPMGLYRQAQDYSKLLLAYFQEGSLQKEKETGQYKVVKSADGSAPTDVFPLIYAWGERTGRSKERAEQFASRVIEAYRLEQVLKTNPDFPKHIKDADRALLVAEYNADPAFAEMNAAMDKPRIALVDQMVKVGRLSKEQGDEWKSVIGYVPFDRIDDFAERFTAVKRTTGRAPLMLTKNPELKGSFDRPVGNVFENYLNTMGWMVGQVMTNDARVQTLRSLEDLGYTGKPSRMPGTKHRTAKAYVKGELMYWDLPSSYDAAAFQELNPPKAKWLQVLGQVSNVLRKSVTILPPFALKQVTDDVQRAIMTSGVKNPGALLRMTLSNFGGLALAELRGIRHPTVSEMEALGLTGEFDFQQGKPAVSLLKDIGYRPRGKFETLMHRLEGITRASDLAVRKAIYDQTIKESQGDQLLAQTRAREFINFRRRGASDFVGAMVTTIPFFNAYIQGMDVLYRAASGKDSSSSVGRAQARRMFYSRAAIAMTLSTLYALGKGDDDEDYNEMDLRTRDSNWILPGGYKLPVPTELGALFKVIPERIVEYMRRQGTPEEQTAWEATRTALAYIMEQYVGRTVPIPQAAKPLLEAWTNYSFFTGRELEGIYQKQQDPSMRRASNTSELAIAIANFSRDVVGVDKISPILVDNALSGYFGSTAGLLVATTDSLLNPTRVDRPLHKYALLSNYLYDPVGTRRMTEFYDEREKVGRANATLAELMKTDLDRAVDYAEKNADVLMMESAINSTLEQLERTRAYRKFLNGKDAAADMSAEEREAELKEIKQMEVELVGWVREAKTAIRQ